MPDNQTKIANRISELYETGQLSDSDLVELMKLICEYLRPTPLLEFGKANGISYPGLLKSKRFKVIEILDKKFVIDNL